MSDQRFADLMQAAFDPVVEETPDLPAWDDLRSLSTPVPMAGGKRHWLAAIGAAAAVLVVLGGSLFLFSGTQTGTTAAVSPSFTTSTTSPTETTEPISDPSAEAVPDMRIGLARPAPKSDGCCDTGPFYSGRILGSEDFTPELINDLSSAAEEILAQIGASPPYIVNGAFVRNGVVYAIAEYGEDKTAVFGTAITEHGDHGTPYLGTEHGDIVDVWTGQGTWILHEKSRDPWVMRLVWVGLPDEAAVVRLRSAEFDEQQRPIGNAAFFLADRPSFNQRLFLEAVDADGATVAEEQYIVDGGGCSARGERWDVTEIDDLPEAVAETRRKLATSACIYGTLEKAATDPEGVYFGFLASDDLAPNLRDLDLNEAVMREFLRTLRSSIYGTTTAERFNGEEQTLYVWPKMAATNEDYKGFVVAIWEDGTWYVAGESD
ncbi:MAG: hypothetical protein ABFR89_04940 [Actinomycetota bacterium]